MLMDGMRLASGLSTMIDTFPISLYLPTTPRVSVISAMPSTFAPEEAFFWRCAIHSDIAANTAKDDVGFDKERHQNSSVTRSGEKIDEFLAFQFIVINYYQVYGQDW